VDLGVLVKNLVNALDYQELVMDLVIRAEDCLVVAVDWL
jgi:hypothetical protein